MKSTWKTSLTVVAITTMVGAGLGNVESASAEFTWTPPTSWTPPSDIQNYAPLVPLTDSVVSLSGINRLSSSVTINFASELVAPRLSVYGSLWGAGVINGGLTVNPDARLNLYDGLLTVAGASSFQAGSLVALGVAPKPPGPVPIGDDFITWDAGTGRATPIANTTYYVQGGMFHEVGSNWLGVAPKPPGPVPIGDGAIAWYASGLLTGDGNANNGDGITFQTGSTLFIDFADNNYNPTIGDTIFFTDSATNGVFSIGEGVHTNLQDGWMIGASATHAQYFGPLTAAPVPEPSTILLLGGGFAVVAGVGIRRRKKADSE